MVIDLDKEYPGDLHICPICHIHDKYHNPHFYENQLRCLNCKLIIELRDSFVEYIWIGWDLDLPGTSQPFVIVIKNHDKVMEYMSRYNTIRTINIKNNKIDIKKMMDNLDNYRLLV